MKKVFILLFIFVFAVFGMTTAKADMSGPEMREFEIVVTNSNGTDYVDHNGSYAGHLAKDEKVYVIYEYDEKYMIGKKKVDNFGIERTESIGYITSFDDFDIVEDEVDPTQGLDDKIIKKFDTAQKAIVYAKDGVDVFKGPSDAYEKVGHLKNGTKLTFKYAIASIDLTYIYVTSGDIKGWVNIQKGAVLIENEKQYVFKTDVETECGVIPKNTVTTPIYRTDVWAKKALFQYNDCETLLNVFKDENIFVIYGAPYKALVDINIYASADRSSDVIGKIPAGSEFTLLATDEYGYIAEEPASYVKFNDVMGWALVSYESFEYVSETEEEPAKIEDTLVVEEKTEEETVKPTTSTKMSLNTLIILCSCGVGLLVITAVVIIILVNKNKKPKVETPVTEESTEEK